MRAGPPEWSADEWAMPLDQWKRASLAVDCSLLSENHRREHSWESMAYLLSAWVFIEINTKCGGRPKEVGPGLREQVRGWKNTARCLEVIAQRNV